AHRERPWCREPQSSGKEPDMDNWESRRKRPEEDRELYREIFYELPYSIRQAAVGLIVIAIGRLLYQWLRGE
ncbi:MAG: hypothetical protein M3N43_07445, partial [Actinomycetota bacterium]|nr:hypothetical protein [Actinomycetota bacterium]